MLIKISEDALNVFDPQGPAAVEELDAYSVVRPHAPWFLEKWEQ